MVTLTITARGQTTLRRELLQHMGVEPGTQIEVEMLPGGQLMMRARRPQAPMSGFVGLLAGRSDKVATLDEIDAAAAKGWTGRP